MKPLHFRSVAERESITAILLLACLSIALPARANSAATVEELRGKLSDDCKKELPESLKVYADRSQEKLLDAFDPSDQCKANPGEEIESHNARVIGPDIWQRRPDWAYGKKTEDEIRRVGACRKNYASIKEAYDHYERIQGSYCRGLTGAMSNAVSCGEPSKKCEAQYRYVKEIFVRFQTVGKEFGASLKKYLSATAKASEEAAKKYEADLKALDTEVRRRNVPGAAVATVELADHPQIKPANGNKNTRTLKDYYDALSGQENGVLVARSHNSAQGVGRLISEHKDAEKKVIKFKTDLDSLVAEGVRVAESSAERWETMLKGIENAGPTKENPIAKISTLAGPATSATQLAGQMLGGNQNQSNPASALTTAATGGPSLAAAAAAAAAGAALSSSFSSSSSQAAPAESFQQQAPAAPLVPNAPDVAKLDGGEPLPTSGVGNPNELPKTNDKSEGGKVVAGQPAFPAFGAGEGTSRMISGTKRAAKGPAAAEAKVPDAGIGEEGFNNFGARGMDPKPGPKGNSVSPGAEVANLLGQMKDLFNFDAGAGAGGPPGSQGFGMGPEPPLDSSGTGLAADGESEFAREEGANELAASEPGQDPAARAEVQGAQFGKVDTSLFKRVRQRHTRCMERGLVLYQLGERVE